MAVDLVTGATGFVGGHVARALLEAGRPVRCLVRPGTGGALLEGLDVERVVGDLREAASLPAALRGVEDVYHVAADYRLHARRPSEIYATNVEGTRALLSAALRAGVRRVVHTSSVGALAAGAPAPGADESALPRLGEVVGHYKRSKFLAEREAEAFAERGLDVVIVNPSTPVGEGDVKPTPTGQVIVDFLRGRIPFYVDTGLNLVDVRDVAAGHLLAAARGRTGERYILGNENVTLLQMLERLERITGRPAPRRRLPHWIPIAAGAVCTGFANLTGTRPRVALEAARMARHTMWFDPAKAVRELGLPRSPVDAALARAVAWFRQRGYVPGEEAAAGAARPPVAVTVAEAERARRPGP